MHTRPTTCFDPAPIQDNSPKHHCCVSYLPAILTCPSVRPPALFDPAPIQDNSPKCHCCVLTFPPFPHVNPTARFLCLTPRRSTAILPKPLLCVLRSLHSPIPIRPLVCFALDSVPIQDNSPKRHCCVSYLPSIPTCTPVRPLVLTPRRSRTILPNIIVVFLTSPSIPTCPPIRPLASFDPEPIQDNSPKRHRCVYYLPSLLQMRSTGFRSRCLLRSPLPDYV